MFNWIKRFKFPGGFKGTLNKNGIGFSWGIPGLRVGLSPSGYKWIYVGIPGTGIGLYKKLSKIRNKSTIKKDIRWKNLE